MTNPTSNGQTVREAFEAACPGAVGLWIEGDSKYAGIYVQDAFERFHEGWVAGRNSLTTRLTQAEVALRNISGCANESMRLALIARQALSDDSSAAKTTTQLCPHGFVLADNICGPCSKGQPNRKTALGMLSDARLQWGMTCECDCPACNGLDIAIRHVLQPSSEETSEIYTQDVLDAAHARTRERLSKLKIDCGNPVMVNTEWYGPCTRPSGHDGDCAREAPLTLSPDGTQVGRWKPLDIHAETKPNEIEVFDGESHIHRLPAITPAKPCPNCFGDKTICMSDGSKRTCEYCGGSGVDPVQNGTGDV